MGTKAAAPAVLFESEGQGVTNTTLEVEKTRDKEESGEEKRERR